MIALIAGALFTVIGGDSGQPPTRTATPKNSGTPSGKSDRTTAALTGVPISGSFGIGTFGPAGLWTAGGGGFLVSTNDGTTWRQVAPAPSDLSWFEDFAAVGDHFVLAIDDQFDPSAVGALDAGVSKGTYFYSSANAGTTWHLDAVPITELSGESLSFPDTTHGFALGSGGVARGALFATINGGRSWREVALTVFTGTIQFTSSRDGWALSDSSPPGSPMSSGASSAPPQLLRTTDGGTTWKKVKLGGPIATAEYVTMGIPHFFDATDGVIAVNVTMPGTIGSRLIIYTTDDGGVTWAHSAAPSVAGELPAEPADFSAPSISHWVVADGQILATGDAGRTWTTIKPSLRNFYSASHVTFVTSEVGVAYYEDVLYRTIDGGRAWSEIRVPPATSKPTSEVTNSLSSSTPAVPVMRTWQWSWGPLPSLVLGAAVVTGVSCGSADACVAIDSQGRVFDFDGHAWSAPTPIDAVGLTAISCANDICAAVDRSGRVTDRVGPDWSTPSFVIAAGATGVSCTADRFCAAVGRDGVAILDEGSWSKSVTAPTALTAISCTSRNFCLAVGPNAEVDAYNGISWSIAPPAEVTGTPRPHFLTTTCASPTFCILPTSVGSAYYFFGNGWANGSVLEKGGSGAAAPPFRAIAVSCTATILCAATDTKDAVSVLGPGGWSQAVAVAPSESSGTVSAVCTTKPSCVALDSLGRMERFALVPTA